MDTIRVMQVKLRNGNTQNGPESLERVLRELERGGAVVVSVFMRSPRVAWVVYRKEEA